MPMDHVHNHVHDAYRLPLPAAPGPELSEFNHHLAGAIVILVGLSAILLYYRPRTFGFLKYVWPASLLALGIYLVLYSDPDTWPTATVGFSHLRSDPAAIQHKTYAVLLILLGGFELSRAAGVLKGEGWKYGFPIVAGLGALYLLAHEQGGGEHSHGHGESMVGMMYQHIIYVLLGVQAAIARVLYDTRRLQGPWAPYIWPSLVTLLGVALVLYRE